MIKAVVILGAGASNDFGAPTLRGMFTDRGVRDYLEENEWLHKSLGDVFWGRRGLDLDSAPEGPSIEEMLTILNDMEAYDNPGKPERAAVRRFKRDLYILIFRALYPGKSSQSGHLNPLLDFARRNFERTTWASFNWDCLFESSFWYSSGDPEVPGARSNPRVVVPLEDWRDGPGKHEFLKLHGGINWWMIDKRLTYFGFSGSGKLAGQWTAYANGKVGDAYPVILEPSYHKYQGPAYDALEKQWGIFRKRLQEADCVLAVGYSLPDSDSLARSSVTTAFQKNKTARWALIDPEEAICHRYGCLLGKKSFRSFRTGLVSFNVNLEANMSDAFPHVVFPGNTAR